MYAIQQAIYDTKCKIAEYRSKRKSTTNYENQLKHYELIEDIGQNKVIINDFILNRLTSKDIKLIQKELMEIKESNQIEISKSKVQRWQAFPKTRESKQYLLKAKEELTYYSNENNFFEIILKKLLTK